MVEPGRARVLLISWALAIFCTTGLFAQDILLSAKDRSTSIQLGDVAYQPGDGFKAGPFRLHPFLRQRVEWNDNLFLTGSKTVMGVMYNATAGMRVDLLPGNHEVSVGYKARYYGCMWKQDPSFTDAAQETLYRSRIGELNRFEHVGELRGVLALPWGRFRASGSVENLSDPLNFEYAGHIDRTIAQGSLGAMLLLNRVLFEAGADLRWSDFKDAFNYLDSLEWSVNAETGLKIGAKFYTSLAWSWDRQHYYPMSAYDVSEYGEHFDFENHSFSLGVKGSLAPKLDINLKIGISLNQTIEGSQAGRIDTGFYGRALVKWSLTESLLMEATYAREYEISQYSSFQVMDRGELKLVYSFSLRVAARIYGFLENTAPAGGLSFLRVGGGAQIEYRAYGWMSLGVGYEWLSRHTSIPDAEFMNNKAWVHLTIYF